MDFNLNGITFNAQTTNDIKNQSLKCIKSGEISEYLLSIDFGKKISPSTYTLTWCENANDAYALWSPNCGQNTNIPPEWAPHVQQSKTASGMPLISVYSKSNVNKTTVYLSDTANACAISVGVVEYGAKLKFSVTLFSDIMPEISTYSVVLVIDNTKNSFSKTIKNAREWWTKNGHNCAVVPSVAKYPLYSFWYSYHQQTYANDIILECKKAKEFGFKSVIIDDGWQTDDNNGGYAYCGDWEVAKSKIPDMKNLVDQIHAMDLKFILWFSVPFVGYKSKIYERFKGKYLKHIDRLQTSVLDPRFKEVREYLTSVYVDAVKTYGYDGLKLDFIDKFTLSSESSKNYAQMDCISVEEGVDKLLNEITLSLKKINPNIIIEFRQSYVGPMISKYGNIFRVGDCPDDAISNKIGTLNLRLTSGSTAVHSDMIIWNNFDSNENVLNQLLGVMFSVPQISVRLNDITNDHKKLLKNYLDFYTKHHNVLLNGNLQVYGVEAGYTMASSALNDEKITVIYSNQVVKYSGLTEYIFNATGDNYVYIECDNQPIAQLYDYYGNLISTEKLSSKVNKINLLHGYMIKILPL